MNINPNDLFETELINKTDGEKIVLEYSDQPPINAPALE